MSRDIAVFLTTCLLAAWMCSVMHEFGRFSLDSCNILVMYVLAEFEISYIVSVIKLCFGDLLFTLGSCLKSYRSC